MKVSKKTIIIIGIFFIFFPFINFTKAQELTIIVTSPKDVQIVFIDSTFDITWIPPDNYKHVSIILFQNLIMMKGIDMYIDNSGSFIWNVTREDYNTGKNYRIKIIVFGNSAYYGYSGFFIIRERPPKISIDAVTFITIMIIIIVLYIMYNIKKKKKIYWWLLRIKNKLRT